MGRPTKEERTCPDCGSTNTFQLGYKTKNVFYAINMRICLACRGKVYIKN